MGLFFWRKNKINREAFIKGAVFLLLLSLIVVIFWQKTEFSSSDLGRHIENGRVVFSNPSVLFSNFYSYTEPGIRFVNHHWLSGVVYYGSYLAFGFSGLHVLNILVVLAAFIIFFLLARKKANFYTVSLLSLPVIFLLSERVEVRPEIFSYLFLGITWLMLESKKISGKKRLFILFPLFVLWANMHICFFLGLGLVFFWLADKIIRDSHFSDFRKIRKVFNRFKIEISLFISLIVASLLTPNHFLYKNQVPPNYSRSILNRDLYVKTSAFYLNLSLKI